MSVNVPTTEWRRTSGNGELATTDATLVTDSGLQLITLSGDSLIALFGSYTPIPASTWAIVEPTPISVWQKTSGNTESVFDGPSDIDDTLGNLLVDTVSNNIVDTGIDMNITPESVWTENDGV